MRTMLIVLLFLLMQGAAAAEELEQTFLEGCVDGCRDGAAVKPGENNTEYVCTCICRGLTERYEGEELVKFIFRLAYGSTTDSDNMNMYLLQQNCIFQETLNGKR